MTDQLDHHQTFIPVIHEAEPSWMHEYFRAIADTFTRMRNHFIFEPTHVEPTRKFDGLTVFADGSDWDPGAGRGVYYWNSHQGTVGEWALTVGATTDTVLTVPLPSREGEEVNDLATQQDVNWYLWDEIETKADTVTVEAAFQRRSLQDNAQPETIISGSSYSSMVEWYGYDASDETKRSRSAWVTAAGRVHSNYDYTKGLAATDFVTKAYVDGVGGGGGEGAPAFNGGTITNLLNIDKAQNEAFTVTKNGAIGLKIWADGSLDAKGAKVEGFAGTDDCVLPQAEIERLIAAVDGGETFDGGTVNTPLVLADPTREINVVQGVAGQLSYNGTKKFRWGSGKNFSEQELDMGAHKISALATPVYQSDAVTKDYCDSNASAGPMAELVPGRAFTYKNTVDWYRLERGEFGLYTGVGQPANIAVGSMLAMHQDDLSGFTFHIGNSTLGFFPLNITLLDTDGKMQGIWEANPWGSGMQGATSSGGYAVAVPLTQFKGVAGFSFEQGSNYQISSSLWGK